MIIGAVLLFTWLILLLRYPAKALPVSLAAAIGLAIEKASAEGDVARCQALVAEMGSACDRLRHEVDQLGLRAA